MTASIATAMEECLSLFTAVYSDPVDYPNSKFKIPTNKSWARWRAFHETGGQYSLANNTGNTRFDREGTIIIQLFSPLNKGAVSAYTVAETVMSAYEGKRTPSDVWFRDVRLNEVEGAAQDALNWFQLNVLIDFTYDQLK